ncbi:MAG: hypothetical protein H9W83_04265, partial [Leuconostoc sp.]|nr:hypothetical protein [Leuconostoc sp.]
SDARRKKADSRSNADELDLTNAAMIAAPFKQTKTKSKKTKKNGTSTELHVSSDDDSDDEENGSNLPFAIRDQKLIARAFAGADVVGEFESEKRQTMEDEDEKVVDNTLPGWGSWAGEGLSKKARARNKGRFLTKTDGIKVADRKDAKLDKVIINEKRVKKVCFHSAYVRIGPLLTGGVCRIPSTWLAACRIHSRRRRSMRGPLDCLLDRSGARRRRSRTRRSRASCLSRALSRRCRSRWSRLMDEEEMAPKSDSYSYQMKEEALSKLVSYPPCHVPIGGRPVPILYFLRHRQLVLNAYHFTASCQI